MTESTQSWEGEAAPPHLAGNLASASQGRKPADYLGKPSVLSIACDITDFMEMEIAEQQFIIEPFFPACGSGMIWGIPGAAKTWTVERLAIDVANGSPFLGFNVPERRRVMLVDGEMPLAILHHRLASTLNGADPPTGWLSVISAEDMMRKHGRLLNLAEEDEQTDFLSGVMSLADAYRPELLILDNMSALFLGINENDNGQLAAVINAWTARLHFLGVGTLLVHHAGKAGMDSGPRGGSVLTGPLDFHIGLDPRSDKGHPHFDLIFKKQRHHPVQHRTLEIEIVPSEFGMEFLIAGTSGCEMKRFLQTVERLRPGSTREMEDDSGYSKSTAGRLAKQARDSGWMDGWMVTEEGRGHADIDGE